MVVGIYTYISKYKKDVVLQQQGRYTASCISITLHMQACGIYLM